MRSTTIAAVAMAVVLAVAASVVWAMALTQERERLREEARETAASYAAAISARDWDRAAAHADADARSIEGHHASVLDRLIVTEMTFSVGETEVRGDQAVAALRARLVLAGLGPWEYPLHLPLVRAGDGWQVDWSAAALHPELTSDVTFERERSWHERASVLDREGHELDVEATSLGLLVGGVEEVDEESAAGLGGAYLAGDRAGVSGLERSFDDRLAGAPNGAVVAVRDGEHRVLHRFEGRHPEPVRTTIDPEVQAAADRVITGGPTPRAIVAVDAASGEVLALANWPPSGFNRALAGRYPPGSTFKVVTAAGLLRSGLALDDLVSCPRREEIGGWGFRNFEEMALGEISFRRAIYDSCNTAFVRLTADLDDGLLVEAAASFGFGVDYRLPVPHADATFPEWENDTVKAAQGFGQGRVEAPPVHLATVAAAVADGTWRPPRIVIAPNWDPQVEPHDLGDVAGDLRDAMELVVTRGTAADAGLPDDVAGKTGTAEYGSGDPLPTHAWFIGYAPWTDTTIAFAVLVEGGEAGGRVAAPLARRFLEELRG